MRDEPKQETPQAEREKHTRHQGVSAAEHERLMDSLKEARAERNHITRLYDRLKASYSRADKKCRSTIAEYQRTEKALRQSEARLHDLFENAPVAYYSVGINRHLLDCNRTVCAWLGYTREELIGKDVRELYAEESKPKADLLFQKFRRREPIENEEMVYLKKDGSKAIGLVSATAIRDKRGKITASRSIVKDITELKQAQQRSAHINNILKTIRNVNQLIVREKDRDTLLKKTCQTLIETRGFRGAWIALFDKSGKLVTAAEAGIGKSFLPMLAQIKKGSSPPCIRKALRAPEPVPVAMDATDCGDCLLLESGYGPPVLCARLQHQDAVYGVLAVSIPLDIPIIDEELSLFREVAGDIAFALHDIELEEKGRQAEEALRQSEEFSTTLLASTPYPIFVAEADTSVRYVNPAMQKLTGFTLAELKGVKAPYPWWTEETLTKIKCDFEEAFHHGAQEREELFRKKNGERFWVQITATPVYHNGEYKYYIANWADITRRKKAEEETQKAHAELAAIYSSAPIAMMLVDRDRRVQKVNGAAMAFARRTAEEMAGLRGGEALRCLHSLDDPKGCGFGPYCEVCSVRRAVQTSLDTGKACYNVEAMLPIMKENAVEDVWLLVSTTPVKFGDSEWVLVCAQDITERKKMENALLQERNKANEYLQIAGVMMLGLDAEGKITLVNKRACEILGCEEKAITGRDWFETFIPPRVRKQVKDIFSQLTAGNVKPFEYFENPVLTASGAEREIAWHNIVAKDAEGRVTGTLSSGEDITERKKMEEALRQSEIKFSAAFRSNPVAMRILELETGRMVDVNNNFLTLTGYSREEVIGHSALELGILRDEKEWEARLKLIREKGSFADIEVQVFTKSGDRRTCLMSSELIELQGKLYTVNTLRDVTEHLETERALRQSEEKYRSLVDNIKLGIYRATADPQGRFLEVNPAMSEILGYSKEELLNMNVTSLYDRPEERQQLLAQAMTQDRMINRRSLRRKDGTKIMTLAKIAVVKDSQGKILYLDGILEDVTEAEKAELRERELQVLKELDRLRSELMSNVSHELRTPLASIKGFTSTLLAPMSSGVRQSRKNTSPSSTRRPTA
jgi:PAS domain S-box-containing protein